MISTKKQRCNVRDASERGLGATLLQMGQPVPFASRTFTETEQRYAQMEKECLAIVFACEKFPQYISQRDNVIVESDHKPVNLFSISHSCMCHIVSKE